MKKAISFQRVMTLIVMCAISMFLLTNCVKEISLGSIQGIVTNSSNNEPIQGVNVSLSPTGLSTVTGSDGRYEFKNLEAGQYTVQAMAEGYEANTKSITIVQGNVSSGDMTLKPEIAGFKLNMDYLDFGTGFNQRSFKLINTSTSLSINWSISTVADWISVTPSSGSLNANQEVTLIVDIDRTLIESSTTTNISVEAAGRTVVLPVNVSVSGSEGPKLQLSVNALDFGSSPYTTSLPFYVMNAGPVGTSLNWACSNITVDWLTIEPATGNTAGGSSTPVMASIDRSKIDGMVSTAITISGAGTSSSITISAASEGAGVAILQLSEGSLDFGETEVTKTFMVKNVGSTGTVLEWTIDTPSEDWLTLTPMSGSTNAGNGTLVTVVVDRNKIHGTVSTTVTVRGANTYSNISVSAANLVPVLEVSTSTIDFGKQSITQTFEVKNTGDEGSLLEWTIPEPSVEWLTVSPTSGSLNANENSTVTLTIDRTKFDGSVTTTLRVTSGDQTSNISVSATTPTATMQVPITTVDFGKIDSQKTIEIRNTGETGSYVNWIIAAPSVDWLTVSPMTGSATPTSMSLVTLTVDRAAFVGEETTSITITGAGSTATVTLTVDNSVVATDGLYAYFTFDSDEIVDWTGNFSGLNYGVLFSDDAPGGTGKSAVFDGETSYIYIPDNVIPGGVPYSINFWFKTGRNDQTFFGTKYVNYSTVCYRMGLTGNSCVFIQLERGYNWTSTNPITAYVNNTWHMLTFTYNGTTANYYIDGILLETVSTGGLLWANGLDAFYFGKHFNTGVYYGKLDNFRSYNRALTQNEVRAIYNAKQ